MSFRELPVALPELRGLYAALGESRIREIMRRFYAAMGPDLLIGFFFAGHDLSTIADRQSEFLLRAMGAVPSFSGKPPAQAHSSLPPILSGHFDRRLKILETVLRAECLPENQIHVWIGFENAFRSTIVSD